MDFIIKKHKDSQSNKTFFFLHFFVQVNYWLKRDGDVEKGEGREEIRGEGRRRRRRFKG